MSARQAPTQLRRLLVAGSPYGDTELPRGRERAYQCCSWSFSTDDKTPAVSRCRNVKPAAPVVECTGRPATVLRSRLTGPDPSPARKRRFSVVIVRESGRSSTITAAVLHGTASASIAARVTGCPAFAGHDDGKKAGHDNGKRGGMTTERAERAAGRERSSCN